MLGHCPGNEFFNLVKLIYLESWARDYIYERWPLKRLINKNRKCPTQFICKENFILIQTNIEKL